MNDVIRVALCGPPGSGKSTVRRLSERLAPDFGLAIHHLRLAEPLYAAKDEIYRLAGRPLLDSGVQDGRLLNVLGVEMRRINPDVLADYARSRLACLGEALESTSGLHAVICDDMRPPDAPFMQDLGFEFVAVRTSAPIAVARRKRRGDVTLGSLNDPNEVGFEALEVSTTLNNDGTLESLTDTIREFWVTRLS